MRTPKEESKNARLRALAAERRQPPPVLPPRLPKALDQVVTRCMDQDPSHRYGTGRELRAVLEGCLDLQAAERGIPDVGRMRGIAAVHPFVWLIVLALAPQIVATVINIVYNEVRIIRHLTQEQQAIFGYVILGYNSYGYITGLAIATVYILPVWRAWRMVPRVCRPIARQSTWGGGRPRSCRESRQSRPASDGCRADLFSLSA